MLNRWPFFCRGPFGTSWLWDPIQALTGSGPAWLSMRSAGAATPTKQLQWGVSSPPLLLMGISPGGVLGPLLDKRLQETQSPHFTRRGDLAPDPEVI